MRLGIVVHPVTSPWSTKAEEDKSKARLSCMMRLCLQKKERGIEILRMRLWMLRQYLSKDIKEWND